MEGVLFCLSGGMIPFRFAGDPDPVTMPDESKKGKRDQRY
jgi:hypothetical protein